MKFELNTAERELLAALCNATLLCEAHGLRELTDTMAQMNHADWRRLESLAGRFTEAEDPPSHEIKLNW